MAQDQIKQPFPSTNPASEKDKASAFTAEIKSQAEAIGKSGTEIYAGYFSEEYLDALKGGPDTAKVYDRMRRSEAQIAMLINAITNPIKSACWEIEAHESEGDFEDHADFIKSQLFDAIDFENFKHEALTFIPFGFSVFEFVHNVVFNHPKFGTFNGLKAIAFRSQKTIQSWKLEPKTGAIVSIEQFANGDLDSHVNIPGEFVLVFTNQKEGDNYEGISSLRGMYGAYIRKRLYLKLCAIGVEKYAVGTPVGTVPANKENSKDFEKFKETLRSFCSHETAFITKPEGWAIDIQKNDFDASKIVELLKFENTEMINAVVANFLALGTNGSGGAFALSNDLSDFFTSGLQTLADTITTALNRKLIPDLIKMNFGEQEGYPKIKVSGISDKAGKELAEIISSLVDKKVIKPDDTLEAQLREKYKLPKADPATARDVNPAPAPQPTQPTPTQMKFAEGATPNAFTDLLDKGKTETKALMQARLKAMADDLKKKVAQSHSAAKTDAGKIEAPTKAEIDPKLIESYKIDLQNVLAKYAAASLVQAEGEAKSKSQKLNEILDSLRLADSSFFDALPDSIKAIVTTRAALLSDSQAADIAKVVLFQFSSSSTGTEDTAQIEKEIDDAVQKVLDGGNSSGMSIDAAAGNAVSAVANQTRQDFFFAPDVASDIESFTFENNDPVSACCQELAGTTFAANDPQVDEYFPPLHHNCKSTMRANLKGTGAPQPIDGKVDLSEDAKKAITLSESLETICLGGPGSGGAREGAGRKPGNKTVNNQGRPKIIAPAKASAYEKTNTLQNGPYKTLGESGGYTDVKGADVKFSHVMPVAAMAQKEVRNEITPKLNNFKSMLNENGIESEMIASAKTPESILNKMNGKWSDKTLSQGTDFVRGRIVLNSQNDADRAVAMLSRGTGWKVIEHDDFVTTGKKGGYFGQHLLVKTSNGVVAEFQFLTKEQASSQKLTHKLYKPKK